MIAIVHYGLGNVHAIANIYKRLNVEATIASSPGDIVAAERIILPGVGSFDWAMSRLNESGIRQMLDDAVLVQKKPVLGICVGMQMMAKRSDEGELPGLGWIDAEVKKFDQRAAGGAMYLPHMGWNDVKPRLAHPLFKELDSAAQFYFLHSYYFLPHNVDDILAETDYSGVYTSSVKTAGNIFGVQFHPEKSHQWGIQLLKNFSEI